MALTFRFIRFACPALAPRTSGPVKSIPRGISYKSTTETLGLSQCLSSSSLHIRPSYTSMNTSEWRSYASDKDLTAIPDGEDGAKASQYYRAITTHLRNQLDRDSFGHDWKPSPLHKRVEMARWWDSKVFPHQYTRTIVNAPEGSHRFVQIEWKLREILMYEVTNVSDSADQESAPEDNIYRTVKGDKLHTCRSVFLPHQTLLQLKKLSWPVSFTFPEEVDEDLILEALESEYLDHVAREDTVRSKIVYRNL